MTARFPSMIATINLALKRRQSQVVVPINSLCYNILTKLVETNVIFGFSLLLPVEKEKKDPREIESSMALTKRKLTGYPKAKIFIPALPRYVRLKTYPLTHSNYISVRKQPIFRFRSFLQKGHGRNRYLLLTTPHGLKWDFELLHDCVGGKLLLSVLSRV